MNNISKAISTIAQVNKEKVKWWKIKREFSRPMWLWPTIGIEKKKRIPGGRTVPRKTHTESKY